MDDPPGILPQQHLFIPVSPHDHTSAGEIDLDFHCHFTNPFFKCTIIAIILALNRTFSRVERRIGSENSRNSYFSPFSHLVFENKFGSAFFSWLENSFFRQEFNCQLFIPIPVVKGSGFRIWCYGQDFVIFVGLAGYHCRPRILPFIFRTAGRKHAGLSARFDQNEIAVRLSCHGAAVDSQNAWRRFAEFIADPGQ